MTGKITLARLCSLALLSAFFTSQTAASETLSQDDMQRTLAASLDSCANEFAGNDAKTAELKRMGIEVVDPDRPSFTWKSDTGDGPEFLGNSKPRTIYQPVGDTPSCLMFLFRPALNYPTTLRLAKAMMQTRGWTPVARSTSKFSKDGVTVSLSGNTRRDMYHSIKLVLQR